MSMYVKAVSVAMLIVGIFIAPVRAGDPIQGLDVKLGKNPGSQIIETAVTEEDGSYVFKEYVTGAYKILFDFTDYDDTVVEVTFDDTSQGKVAVNTTRSNIKHQKIIVYDPPALDGTSKDPGRYFKTITINQTRLGRIKGQITEDVTVGTDTGTGTVKIFTKNRETYENRRKGEVQARDMR